MFAADSSRACPEGFEVSQSKKNSRIASASRNQTKRRKRRLRLLTWEEVGRPWPPGREGLLDGPQQNKELRLDLVKKLLAGEGDQSDLHFYPKFSSRDFERAALVVRTFAPHRAPEIELLIRFNYPRPRNMPGHPREPMTERAALAFELLKCCRVPRPAQTIHAILKTLGKHITEESIERNYRRRNKVRLVRVPGGVMTQIPASDLHRMLLWRLHCLFSPTQQQPYSAT
jgi:hypothetical protein